jgi:hypothetical protein
VALLQTGVGGVTSRTVTTELQVAVLPFTSVTVSVTVLGPMFEQLKLDGNTDLLWIPHASVDPLSTWAAVTLPPPEEFRLTVLGRQSAVGGVTSRIVTVELQVPVFPLLSVTVNVTEFAPTFEQLNVFGLAEYEAIPQLSEEGVVLLLICEAGLNTKLPLEFRSKVRFLQRATGASLSTTVTI